MEEDGFGGGVSYGYFLVHLETVVDGGKFSGGEIGKLVHGYSEGSSASVELLDKFEVLLPCGKAVLKFRGGIHLVVLAHPIGEQSLELGL